MACQKKTTNYPEEMPSDFGLSLNFGYYGKEEVNFYNNTITKDLIEGGRLRWNLAFRLVSMCH